MKPKFLVPMFAPFFLLCMMTSIAKAQEQENEVIVPAGTILHCTLNEPNFSSKTVDVGTPVVCPLSGMMMFDSVAFPRGTYLGGHLVADKDPGRLAGKGYLQLEFDHLGLPEGQIPVPTTIIGANGYKVDKQGKIIGHGHATRDTVEWMIPPLWPEKLLTLPARGPRPTLKGEEGFTLRLMDDVPVPARHWGRGPYVGTPPSQDSPHLETRPSQYSPQKNNATPSRYTIQAPAPVRWSTQAPATVRSSTAANSQVAAAPQVAPASGGSAVATNGSQNMLVLRNGTSYVATGLRTDGNQLTYTLGDGSSKTVSLDEVDWTKTFRNNAENNTELAVSDDGPKR